MATTRRVLFRHPNGDSQTAEIGEQEYVLEAGLREGIDLPYRCLQGWCLTCAARLVEGEVDQRDARRYYEQDRDARFILPCTARAVSDLSVETHAREQMRANRARLGLPFPKGNWGG